MDMLLHVAGLVANLQDGVYDTYISTQVRAVKVLSLDTLHCVISLPLFI
jgi:hypothetical protein